MSIDARDLADLPGDALEVRLDTFGEACTHAEKAFELVSVMRNAAPEKLLIVTCSVDSAAAGLFRKGSEERRIQLLVAAVRAGADWVDLDSKLAGLLREAPGYAEDFLGCKILLSWHPLFEPIEPGDPALDAPSFVPRSGDSCGAQVLFDLHRIEQEASIEALQQLGLTIVGIKFVPTFHKPADVLRLLAWIPVRAHELRDAGLLFACFAARANGAFTRQIGGALGSDFLYAAGAIDDVAPVPGQPLVEDLSAAWPNKVVPQEGAAIYGVLGYKVQGSLSPELFNHLFAATGIAAVYTRFDFEDPGSLFKLMQAGSEGLGGQLRGLSVTAPHKGSAWLFAGASGAAPEAGLERLGVLNTLLFERGDEAGGELICRGANTDLEGVRAAIVELLGEAFEAAPRELVVLGAGGAARAVLAALAQTGATPWSGRTTVLARDPMKAMSLAREFGAAFGGLSELETLAPDLLVHTTPVGTLADRANTAWLPGSRVLAGLAERNPKCAVLDANYSSGVATGLVGAARAMGLQAAGGATWFLTQALAQFRHFTGKVFDDPTGARTHLESLLVKRAGEARRPWIVLMGLRGSGKTALGAYLAQNLGLGFVDLDEELAREAQIEQVGDLFTHLGEIKFRAAEVKKLGEVLSEEAGVLAVGGGAFTSLEAQAMFGAAGAFGVWLSASEVVLARRVLSDGSIRPALFNDADPKREAQLAFHARASTFRRLAGEPLDTGALSESEATDALVEIVRSALHMDSQSGDRDVDPDPLPT